MENTIKIYIPSLFGLVQIVFIILKLAHVVDWFWSWVLSPIWIGASLALVVFIIFLIIVGMNK